MELNKCKYKIFPTFEAHEANLRQLMENSFMESRMANANQRNLNELTPFDALSITFSLSTGSLNINDGLFTISPRAPTSPAKDSNWAVNARFSGVWRASPGQNRVLVQVSRNLNNIKDFILTFIQFHFKNDNYQSPPYASANWSSAGLAISKQQSITFSLSTGDNANTLNSTLKADPGQNRVLVQVSRNLNNIKETEPLMPGFPECGVRPRDPGFLMY